MPVIGHALVGLGTGLATVSARRRQRESQAAGSGHDYWLLLTIVLAYLPDISAQSLHAAGVADVSRLTHSIGFAAISAPIAGWLIARLGLARPRFATLVALASVLLHVLLDLLQGTDRAVLWPFSSRGINLGVAVLPSSLQGELVVAGTVVGAVVLAARARGIRVVPSRLGVLPVVCVGVVLALAVTTHVMRDRRELQLRYAKWLAEGQHSYARALEVLDAAERWPSPAKPGRIDYLRAECLERLGERRRAEQHYLKSYAADPTYFWVVADLAIFYASGPSPEAARRLAAAPYVERLTRDFSKHPELTRTLDRVRRHLASPPAPD